MTLILFYSPFHSFVHKTLVAAHECGLWDEVERVPTFPFRNTNGELVRGQYSIEVINPLDKVPTLVDEEGQVIFGSQAICEFLDARGNGALFPAPGPTRWDALTRQSLGDSLFEFAVQMSMEQWRPPDEWRIDMFEWLTPKMERALDWLDGVSAGWSGFDIGHAALLQGISYIATRTNHWDGRALVEEPMPWSAGRPALAAWYSEAIRRPSVQTHLDRTFEGEMSPRHHSAALAAVRGASA